MRQNYGYFHHTFLLIAIIIAKKDLKELLMGFLNNHNITWFWKTNPAKNDKNASMHRWPCGCFIIPLMHLWSCFLCLTKHKLYPFEAISIKFWLIWKHNFLSILFFQIIMLFFSQSKHKNYFRFITTMDLFWNIAHAENV